MVAPGVGLQSHIWNNNLRSMILLGFYPLIMLAIFWACAYVVGVAQFGTGEVSAYQLSVTGQGRTLERSFDIVGTRSAVEFASAVLSAYWPIVLAVIAIWFTISFFFHSRMVGAMARSHSVTRKEEPELYNLLENLCIAQGMPMPALNIIETHARNAFASGINERSYAVTVTRGLMNSLQKDELEAVLAHELAHIMNRDVRLLMVTVIFTGMIGFAAQMAWNSIRFSTFRTSSRGNGKGSGTLIILGIALVLWLGYMATLFMRFALSRRREYMADAGAVQMTKNPESMMRALMRIAGRDRIPETTDDIMMMCVENKARFLGLFATHPPITQRIEAISQTTNTPVPVLKSLPPAEKTQRFEYDSSTNNPWLTRQRRKQR